MCMKMEVGKKELQQKPEVELELKKKKRFGYENAETIEEGVGKEMEMKKEIGLKKEREEEFKEDMERQFKEELTKKLAKEDVDDEVTVEF